MTTPRMPSGSTKNNGIKATCMPSARPDGLAVVADSATVVNVIIMKTTDRTIQLTARASNTAPDQTNHRVVRVFVGANEPVLLD